MYKLQSLFIKLVKKSKSLSALSCRLTKLTGKSKYKIHPKHLIKQNGALYKKCINKKDVVLDLGCGNGQHTIKIARKCKKIFALEINQSELKIAKNTMFDLDIKNINFINTDLEKKLPFKSNYFDKIFCLDVLEHIYNRNQLLKEIKRVSKKNGNIFLTVPNKDTSWKKLQNKYGLNFFSDPDHKIEYSLNEIREILNKSGFKILHLQGITFDTPWIGFIDLIGGISLNLYKHISDWKQKKAINDLNNSIGFRIIIKKLKT